VGSTRSGPHRPDNADDGEGVHRDDRALERVSVNS